VLAESNDRRWKLPLGFVERASLEGADAEHLEVVRSDVLALDDFRSPLVRETEFARTRRGCHPGEAFCLGSVVDVSQGKR